MGERMHLVVVVVVLKVVAESVECDGID